METIGDIVVKISRGTSLIISVVLLERLVATLNLFSVSAKEMFPTLQLFDRRACACYYEASIYGTIIKTFKWVYEGAEHTLCALNVDDKYVCIVDINGIKEVD